MAHIYDMYRMTKAVDAEIRRMDKLEPQFIRENEQFAWQPPSSMVKKRFMKRRFDKLHRNKITSSHAAYVLLAATEESRDYLIIIPVDKNGEYEFDSVGIRDKGWVLIETHFGFIPWGLIKAWINEDGKVATSIVILLTAIVGLLAKIAFFGV